MYGPDQLRNAVEFIDSIKREGGDEEAIASCQEGSSFQYTLLTSEQLEQFLPVPVIQLLGWRVCLDDQKLRITPLNLLTASREKAAMRKLLQDIISAISAANACASCRN